MIARVYVCGPYSSDPERNTARAADAARALSAHGLFPFVPHTHFAGWLEDYEAVMAQCFGWLSICDVVLRIPGHSPGADREVSYATARRIPVFGEIGEVLLWAQLRREVSR